MFLAADCIQANNPRVAQALAEFDPQPIRELAVRSERAGAQYLDLNPGYLSSKNEDRMAFLVETVEAVSSLPLILDSPFARVLARGLAAARKTPIINGLSLDQRKIGEILPLAASSGADLVLLLMNENSVAPGAMEEKLALALELREHCLAAGLAPDRLIYDPLLPNLGEPDAYFKVGQCLKAIRLFSSGAFLGEEARAMVGLSNLRSGLRGRIPISLETTCLTMAAGAGLSLVLADPLQSETAEAFRLTGGFA
ncbi:MAG: dihydropteroate synthase [Pseudomonadota bacterium]